MITLTPNSTPLDISHVMDVLTLAADPDATKQRLSELKDLLDRANAATEQANSLHVDATRRMAVYEASVTNLTKDKDAFARLTKEVSDRQSSADAALVARKIDLDAREAELTASFKKLDQREKAATQREADASVRHAAILSTGDQVVAMKAEYENKLAKLRDITGGK